MTTPRTIQFELEVEGVSADSHVEAFRAREALSEPGRVSVTLRSPEPPQAADLIGRPAVFRVLVDDAVARAFHGVVWSTAVREWGHDRHTVEIEIAPVLATLGLGRDSRIFRDKGLTDIVDEVLRGAGLAADGWEWAATGSYAPRPHVAQYDESDLAFVERLLAAQGVGYVVEHRETSAVVRFFDDPGAHAPIEGESELLYRGSRTELGVDSVADVRERRTTVSDAAMLRDYDYEHAGRDLSARREGEGALGREVYLHPGGYADDALGRRLAQRTLERLALEGRTRAGTSDCVRLAPGRRFTIAEHPRQTLNGELLIYAVEHVGRVREEDPARPVTYENRWESVPATVPYRPRVAPRSHAPGGVQVAFATVPPGGEIHSDSFGRVKVWFPWDRNGPRDDKSSRWVRVGQLPLSGPMILPRGGFEVLTGYELAELDRPYVMGHLYNGGAPPPYALPGAATRSSIQTATTGHGPGANELRFEDSAGSEELYINASKDLTISVDNDAAWNTGVDESVTIGSNHTLSVGSDLVAVVGSSRTLSVGGSQDVNVTGAISDGVNSSNSVDVGGMRKVKTGGDHVENIGSTLDRTVAALQCVTGLAGYGRQIAADSSVTVSAAWVEACGQSRSSQVTGSRNETIGALKLIKAKSVSVSCGVAYAETCAAMSVKAGGGRTDQAVGAVALSAGGGLSVKAKNINITGESRLVVIAGACQIRLSSSGTITVKAPTIDLTGVKSLGQVMHNSN